MEYVVMLIVAIVVYAIVYISAENASMKAEYLKKLMDKKFSSK